MNKHTSTEEITHQFELAKLDYTRLGNQEQALMNKRESIWTKFFTILLIPSGYAGVVGLRGAVFVLALVPFFIACLSLEIKHDEQVLRYDVRKHMRLLAQSWGFANHDSRYCDQDSTRWWQGYYKRAKAASFIMAEALVACVVGLTIGGLAGIGLLALNVAFMVVTAWCLL
jgi:hypothetical protein